MINRQLQKDLLHRMEHLPLAKQKQIPGYARIMDDAGAKGVNGKQLVSFAGAIDAGDLKEIEQRIEEGCEQVVEQW